jgi:hypothetical protein
LSSKIDLKDVSWWKSIKDAYKPRALIITKLSKKGYISLHVGGKPFHIACKHDGNKCGPFSTYSSKTGLSKIRNLKHKYETTKAQFPRKMDGAQSSIKRGPLPSKDMNS